MLPVEIEGEAGDGSHEERRQDALFTTALAAKRGQIGEAPKRNPVMQREEEHVPHQ
jgi:hypothetical protein